jgi:hypothetical protein
VWPARDRRLTALVCAVCRGEHSPSDPRFWHPPGAPILSSHMAPQRAKVARADVGDSVFVLLQGPLAPLNGFAANRTLVRLRTLLLTASPGPLRQDGHSRGFCQDRKDTLVFLVGLPPVKCPRFSPGNDSSGAPCEMSQFSSLAILSVPPLLLLSGAAKRT